MSAVLLLLALPTSLAQDAVLVSRFEASDPDLQSIADRIPGQVRRRLGLQGDLEVLEPADVPYIKGKTGLEFMSSCPSEQVLGCTFDLAEVAEASWAVTGVVRTEPVFDEEEEEDPGVEVELTVLDIEEQSEAWSLVLPYSPGAEGTLTDWVERAVLALAAGELPPEPEPELIEEPLEEEPEDPEQDLSGIERELGEMGHPEGVEDLGEGRQEREHLTMSQLLEQHGEAEPWADMDITPQEYLRWWNSGWGYRSWERMRRGRQGMVTLRGLAGWGAGPRGSAYNGQYAMDDVNWRTVLEYYAWQAAIQGGGLSLGLNVGYGVTPTVDVELGLARHGGPFEASVTKEYLGEEPENVSSEEGLHGMLEVALGARVTPMPFSKLRPVLGGGALLWHGSKVDAHAELPPPPVELPILAANTLLGAYALLGGQYTLSDSASVVLQAPLQGFFGGTEATVWDEGSDYIVTKAEPPSTPAFGWAVQAGVQLHFGGN
jgi:hypothetical protein